MNELEGLLETYKDAIFQKKLETFVSLFDKDVRVFDMWGCWSYDGLAAWQEMVKGWFSSLGDLRDRVTFEEVAILQSGDLATVTAFARFAAISPQGEELRFLHSRLTLVVRRVSAVLAGAGPDTDPDNVGSEGWKIIHQHSSVPIDGGTLKGILKRD
jgi:ketosteroid isomerase-like protein